MQRLMWPRHRGRARIRQAVQLANVRRRRRLRRRNITPEGETE